MKMRLVHIVVIVLVLAHATAHAQHDTLRFDAGKILFQTHCGPCHDVHREIVGPALGSITHKREDAWLLSFIKNSQEVIVSGDPYAGQLFERYNRTVMPAFTDLTETDISNILLYIKEESLAPVDQLRAQRNIMAANSSQEVLKGRDLFNDQCETCHSVFHEAYGPLLASVSKRHTADWLKKFIRNSRSVIKNGDPYANHLFASFDNKVMVNMEFLTDDDIKNILKYISYESSLKNVTENVTPKRDHPFSYQPLEKLEKSTDLNISIFTVFVFLVIPFAVSLTVLLVTRIFRYLK